MAFVCAARGYKIIINMFELLERRGLLVVLGADAADDTSKVFIDK